MTDIPMHSTAESPDADLLDVADISPNTVSGPYADLLREVADISPIKTVDLVDIEKPSTDLLVEETKFSPTIPEPDIIGDNAQFHLREKTVDHVEELIKPSDIAVVPDSCDLISNKPKETKSTPSPVEPVVIEAEPPKSEPKGKEATETIKCVKTVTAKGNPSEKSEIGPKDFFTKYGLEFLSSWEIRSLGLHVSCPSPCPCPRSKFNDRQDGNFFAKIPASVGTEEE
ncbi:hypothetical protein ACFE04_019845 [Oxalis oulophora]